MEKQSPNVIAKMIRFMPPGKDKFIDKDGLWVHRSYYTNGGVIDYHNRFNAVGSDSQHDLVNIICKHTVPTSNKEHIKE